MKNNLTISREDELKPEEQQMAGKGHGTVNPLTAWAVIIAVLLGSTVLLYGIGKVFFWDKYSTEPFFKQQYSALLEKVEADPENVENLVALGWIYFQKEDYTRALQLFGQATALNDRYFPAFFNQGLTYLQTGDFALAITAFLAAAELAPRDHVTHMNLGIAYTLNNEYDKAISSLLQAYTLQPGSAEILIKLGEAYFEAGDMANAQESFVEALRFDPDNVTAKNALKKVGN